MISRKARHARILELLRRRRVESQESLAALLADEGVQVTQATLSRDIRELGLVKVRGSYQSTPVVEQGNNVPPSGALRNACAQFVTRTAAAGNIVVVHTAPGNAHSVCVALDAAGWPEILGTIAGDDTIFILARHPRECGQLLRRFENLMTGN